MSVDAYVDDSDVQVAGVSEGNHGLDEFLRDEKVVVVGLVFDFVVVSFEVGESALVLGGFEEEGDSDSRAGFELNLNLVGSDALVQVSVDVDPVVGVQGDDGGGEILDVGRSFLAVLSELADLTDALVECGDIAGTLAPEADCTGCGYSDPVFYGWDKSGVHNSDVEISALVGRIDSDNVFWEKCGVGIVVDK